VTEFDGLPVLRNPVAIAAFEGWNDAADASTAGADAAAARPDRERATLLVAAPAAAERHHLVLAGLVQCGNEALELAPVFSAGVLNPESVIRLRQRTLRPRFKGAALKSGLRHIRRIRNKPLVRLNRFASAPRDLDPR